MQNIDVRAVNTSTSFLCLSSKTQIYSSAVKVINLHTHLLPLLPQPRCAVTMATDASESKHDMLLEVTESKGPGK